MFQSARPAKRTTPVAIPVAAITFSGRRYTFGMLAPSLVDLEFTRPSIGEMYFIVVHTPVAPNGLTFRSSFRIRLCVVTQTLGDQMWLAPL
jgi:hypothetical protein